MYQGLTAAFVAFLFALSFYWSGFLRLRKVSLMGYTGKHNLSYVQSPLQPSSSTPKKDVKEGTPELLRTASPLVRFDYQSMKPIPYRPFLSQHHLSIGKRLSKNSPQHLNFWDFTNAIVLLRYIKVHQGRLDPD